MRRFPLVAILAALVCCADGEAPQSNDEHAPMLVQTASYEAREGEALFAHYCATCHGSEGRGDGFNAFNLDPKPRDLADLELQRARTDEALVSVIRLGGGAVGLSTGMPPWDATLNDRQIHDLVAFIRILPERMKEPEP